MDKAIEYLFWITELKLCKRKKMHKTILDAAAIKGEQIALLARKIVLWFHFNGQNLELDNNAKLSYNGIIGII